MEAVSPVKDAYHDIMFQSRDLGCPYKISMHACKYGKPRIMRLKKLCIAANRVERIINMRDKRWQL